MKGRFLVLKAKNATIKTRNNADRKPEGNKDVFDALLVSSMIGDGIHGANLSLAWTSVVVGRRDIVKRSGCEN